ncbi:putative uncharacterized protein [Bacteroides sp. CAG:462]|uniref:DUF4199 domain-containing protein n=1 Tax=Phocaeicola sp. TaxID=2773926 RepID=UPI000338D095|nr:putative uncharacterized protein [Bacteroides sp. CAG:462]
MLYGTYMGLFWILKFALLPLGLVFSPLALLFLLLTCAVPVIVFLMSRSFGRQCEGDYPFFSALVFAFQIYLFAALLTAVGHYLYFQFLDNGFIYTRVAAQLELVKDEPAMQAQMTQIKHALDVFYELTPIQLAMQLLSQNIFYGILLSLPTALLTMRRKAVGR